MAVVAAPEPAPAAEAPAPPGPPPAACRVPVDRLAAPEPTAALEDPTGAMAPFYEALARTGAGEEGALTRIGHWSDSTLAADGMSSFARRRLQLAFGDGGHGFILADAEMEHYGHRDIRHLSGGDWKTVKLVGGKTRDGRYGLGGAVSIGRDGSWTVLQTTSGKPVGDRAGRFEVLYLAGPDQGRFDVRVDRKRTPALRVDADSEMFADAKASVEVPDGPHHFQLTVRTGRRVRVYGLVMERHGPGVVYDAFGILGAKVQRFKRIDRVHLERQLALRGHDLMILQFGGNSLQIPGLDWAVYEERFRQTVRTFRGLRPDAACLIASPHDHGRRRGGGGYDTDPKLLAMMPVQRRVALEEGCAWLSVFDAMGGAGAMGEWYRKGMAYGDLRHLRLKGADRLAGELTSSLLAGFREWRAAQGCEETPVARRPDPRPRRQPSPTHSMLRSQSSSALASSSAGG